MNNKLNEKNMSCISKKLKPKLSKSDYQKSKICNCLIASDSINSLQISSNELIERKEKNKILQFSFQNCQILRKMKKYEEKNNSKFRASSLEVFSLNQILNPFKFKRIFISLNKNVENF